MVDPGTVTHVAFMSWDAVLTTLCGHAVVMLVEPMWRSTDKLVPTTCLWCVVQQARSWR